MSTSSTVRQYWAFLSNPNVYRIEDVICERQLDTWGVGTHKVKAGDFGLIWKAKGSDTKRGIVAFAEVLSDPVERTSPNAEYYIDPNQSTMIALRVEIRYITSPELPIWYDNASTSLLGQLSCCRATGGTVFRVTPEQWNSVTSLAGVELDNPENLFPVAQRNPTWARDELILALDLYFRLNPSHSSDKHSEVLELSNVLRGLPIHDHRPDPERFRNPSSVYMKMCNFLRFDPTYMGKGLTRGARAEETIWNEFVNDRERLTRLATAIRAGSQELRQIDEPIPADSEEDFEASEGRVLLKLHKVRERNPHLSQKRKKQAMSKTGTLTCEVCQFNFSTTYGDLGVGFIECHHTQPVSMMKPGEKTRLQDLALVCANCHRMLHRGGETLTISTLRQLLQTTTKATVTK